MQIFVMPGHRTLTLDVRPSATVAVVKQMIHIRTLEQSFYQRDAAGVPADTIKLEYGGRVLDDERPLRADPRNYEFVETKVRAAAPACQRACCL